ncbi:MAG: hypothetical protein QM786_10225 [Breznakibacter sp.]
MEKYQSIKSFKDLEFEIERKQLEVSVLEKQIEISTYELKYHLDPKRLLKFAWQKALGYVTRLFF